MMTDNDVTVMLRVAVHGIKHNEVPEWIGNSLDKLHGEDLITFNTEKREYNTTERGDVWVQAINATPLPVAVWTMPTIDLDGRGVER